MKFKVGDIVRPFFSQCHYRVVGVQNGRSYKIKRLDRKNTFSLAAGYY